MAHSLAGPRNLREVKRIRNDKGPVVRGVVIKKEMGYFPCYSDETY